MPPHVGRPSLVNRCRKSGGTSKHALRVGRPSLRQQMTQEWRHQYSCLLMSADPPWSTDDARVDCLSLSQLSDPTWGEVDGEGHMNCWTQRSPAAKRVALEKSQTLACLDVFQRFFMLKLEMEWIESRCIRPESATSSQRMFFFAERTRHGVGIAAHHDPSGRSCTQKQKYVTNLSALNLAAFLQYVHVDEELLWRLDAPETWCTH